MVKNNNKGFSLVEVIVAVGLMSLLMTLVVTMLINAARFFERQAAMIEIQNEAQLLTNYFTEAIMEATDIEFTCNADGSGTYEFFKKNPDTGEALGKGSQRALQYVFTGGTNPGDNYLYMLSFDKGQTLPSIVAGDPSARQYLLSDEITDFHISFEYGEETTPDDVREALKKEADDTYTPATFTEGTTYTVKNPVTVTIYFTITHNKYSSEFEISANCRNNIDDLKYTKDGTTTVFKAYNR